LRGNGLDRDLEEAAMATAQHAALDGSRVSFTAEADLSTPMTAFGFVRPRGWRRSQPLNVFPAGKSERMLAALPEAHPEIEYTLLGEVETKGGVLRKARVRRPVVTGGHREFIYGVWEGSVASITTSVRGDESDMEDLFERLRFREIATGVAVESPVDETIRPLRCLKEVGATLLEVRPLSRQVTRTLPRQPGHRVENGEVFRRTEASRDVLLVTPTAAVYASPLGRSDEHVELAASISVTWGE
jgi:hypothetical protein